MSRITHPDEDRLISPSRLAERMDGVNENMLAIWRSQRTGPEFIKRNNRVWYLESDVAKWVKEHRTPTGDKPSYPADRRASA